MDKPSLLQRARGVMPRARVAVRECLDELDTNWAVVALVLVLLSDWNNLVAFFCDLLGVP
jgi:hypothetical protein